MKNLFFILLISLLFLNKTIDDENINHWGGDPSLISWWN